MPRLAVGVSDRERVATELVRTVETFAELGVEDQESAVIEAERLREPTAHTAARIGGIV